MATDAIPLDTTPFAGVVPWLASRWQSLRDTIASRRATEEQQQVLDLIEDAARRLGSPLLQASSLDDLDDRIDDLANSSDALQLNIQLAPHMSLLRTSEPLSSQAFAAAVGKRLGLWQGLLLERERQTLDTWLNAQQQVASQIPLAAIHQAGEAARVSSFSLASPDLLPPEIAQLVFHALRAGFCSMAMLQAVIADVAVAPWLARALVERLVQSAKQHLRLLASLPNVIVDEALVPASERLDIAAIAERHRRARLVSLNAFVNARNRLGQ